MCVFGELTDPFRGSGFRFGKGLYVRDNAPSVLQPTAAVGSPVWCCGHWGDASGFSTFVAFDPYDHKGVVMVRSTQRGPGHALSDVGVPVLRAIVGQDLDEWAEA
jgi:hypothetical protein